MRIYLGGAGLSKLMYDPFAITSLHCQAMPQGSCKIETARSGEEDHWGALTLACYTCMSGGVPGRSVGGGSGLSSAECVEPAHAAAGDSRTGGVLLLARQGCCLQLLRACGGQSVMP